MCAVTYCNTAFNCFWCISIYMNILNTCLTWLIMKCLFLSAAKIDDLKGRCKHLNRPLSSHWERLVNYARLYDVIYQIEGIACIPALLTFIKRFSDHHCAG